MNIVEIEKSINKEMQEGKSLFQIALGLTDDDRITILDCRNPIWYPYARMAAWFMDFFENSNGRNYLQASGLENAREVAQQCWKKVFGDFTYGEDSFKSQCWLLDNKESGRTSHLWYGLKNCLDLPPDIRFSIEAYDNPPEYLRLLLGSYQKGDSNGIDFADFVESFEGGENPNPGLWHNRLFAACNEKFRNRANIGVYLHWSSGASIGLGIGVDRIRGDKSTVLYFNGERRAIPKRNSFYSFDGCDTEVRFAGIKKITVSSNLAGVFYRYQSDYRDERSSWWKLVPEKGVIPFGAKELLVVLGGRNLKIKNGEYDGVKLSVEEPFYLNVRNANQNCEYRVVRIFINSRPTRLSEIEVTDGLTIRLSARVPQIQIKYGESKCLSASDMAVCCGDCKFVISDYEEQYKYVWQINDKDIEGRELILNEKDYGNNLNKLRIRCKICNSDGRRVATLARNIIWLPFEVANRLGQGCIDGCNGWEINKSSKLDEIIGDRIRNRVRYYLTGPNGRSEQVYAVDEGMFFWFAKGLDDWDDETPINKPKEFTFKADADGWYVCFPANISQLNFSFNEDTANKKPESVNGVIRIRLLELVPEKNDFVYDGNLQIQSLKCNEKDIARFGNAPLNPLLCKNSNGSWGIYIPKGDKWVGKKYKAVVYTDNTLNEGFQNPLSRGELVRDNEDGSFIELSDVVNKQLEADKEGEIFLALMPDDDKHPKSILCKACFGDDCQMRLIRSKRHELYGGDQRHELLKVFSVLLRDGIPSGHIWLSSRLACYSEPLTVNEVKNYWDQFVNTGVVEDLPSIFYQMLKSNYNFLIEPEWFFSALKHIESVCKRQVGAVKASKKVKELLAGSLIDNQDQKEEGRLCRGKGWCSAIVAQDKLDGYEPLDESGIREMTRLTRFETNLGKSGINAKVVVNNYDYQWGVVGFLSNNNISIKLQQSFEIRYCGKPLQWRFFRQGCNAQNIVVNLDKYEIEASKFLDWRYLNYKENTTRDLLNEYGIENELIKSVREALKEVASQLKNGIGNALINVLDELFNDIDVCDESVTILVGMASAILLTIGRANQKCPIDRDGEAYTTLTSLTRIYFEKKVQESDGSYWRRLMREIVANMRLLSYLNVEII